MARYTNKHHRDAHLNIGNLVYISTASFPLACYLSCKLALHWVGLFLICHIVSSIAFYIYFPDEYGCVHPVFYVSYLQPHLGPAPPLPTAPLLLDHTAAGEYELEDSLDSCIGHFETEHLIK